MSADNGTPGRAGRAGMTGPVPAAADRPPIVLTRREAIAAGIGLLATSCFSDRPGPMQPPADNEVEVDMTPSLTFSPATVQVPVGGTVVWVNTSSFPHSATGDPSKALDPSHVVLPEGATPWDSGILTAGQVFRHTFTVPGEYRYFCIPHELQNMLGTIIVEP